MNKRSTFITTWTALRLISPALMFIHPLTGMIVNYLLDAVDGDIFQRINIKRNIYQKYDKLLDLWFYCFLAIYIQYAPIPDFIKFTLILLFVYRVIGNMVYTITSKEWVLLLFPNIFSDLYCVYLVIPVLVESNFTITMFLMVVYSLIKEWWIHIAKLDITDLLFERKT